jgi:peptidyl-prolyl cis-trans isomerase SurA
MKNQILRFVSIFILAVAFASTAMQKIDGIAAFVGDSIILTSELDAYILMKTGGVADSSNDSLVMTMLRHQSLDELIDGKVLLVRAAKDTNVIVTENEIDAELNSRIQMIMRQNNLTPGEFESVLLNQQGISLAKFKTEVRKQIRQELLKQKIQQLYVSSGNVSRGEVEQFFAQYKDSLPPAGKSVLLSSIQIKVTASDKIRQDAYARIKAIKERIDNGEDFSEAAKQFSDGPDAAIGGDLGFISKGSLSELVFEEKAFSMQPGGISDIFETRLGFHFITVIAKKDNMVHVKQIFVPVSAPEDQITRTKTMLDSIRIATKSAQDFSAAVRSFSTDEISKSRDGALGWQELASLEPFIVSAIDPVATGKISNVVQKDNILYLFRLDDRKDSRPLSLEEDWAELSTIAQRINSQKKLIALVSKWRQETFIDIRL